MTINTQMIQSRKAERANVLRNELGQSQDNIRRGREFVDSTNSEKKIELLENVSIDERFHKSPNNIFDLMPKQGLRDTEFCIYSYLFRLSYGWGRNWCRIGHDGLCRALGMNKSAVRRALPALEEKKCVCVIEEDVISNMGTLYVVYTPDQILSGMLTMSRVTMSRAIMSRVTMSRVTMSRDKRNINSEGNIDSAHNEQSDHVHYEHTHNEQSNQQSPMNTDAISGMSNMSMVTMSRIKDNTKDNSKNTLSLVMLFYSKIGQEKISKDKRERALKDIQELEADGFTKEDISYAIDWTIKNAKKKPYDFSLIKSTIGQAMAEKEKDKKRESMKEEKSYEQEQMELEAKAMSERKSFMPENERKELKEKALERIRADKRIKPEFITDMLVEATENEILKERNL